MIIKEFSHIPHGNLKWEPHRSSRVKNGQLKLLLYEILFFVYIRIEKLSDSPLVILYLGSASGHHLNVLIKGFAFLNVRWELFDKKRHSKALSGNNVHIYEEYFDLNLHADYYKNRNVILISDIRTTDFNNCVTDKTLLRDYAFQNAVYTRLQPVS